MAFIALHARALGKLTQVLARDGTELLHHCDAVELRPDVGHATVLEAVSYTHLTLPTKA